MARLTAEKREDIKNALLLGDSQYKVAQDFEVSPATVNKIFKELDKNLVAQTEKIVNDEIAIKSILATQSERFCKSFDDKVNEQLRRQNLVFNASEKALVKLSGLIDEVDEAQDMKHIVDAIDKASITLGVNQRHSNSQVQINNSNAQQTNIKSLDDFYE